MSTAALLDADFRLPNYDHQIDEFEGYCDAEARGYSWTMRAGKSKAAVDKICHLYARRHEIDAVLIFAPNGVHANWLDVEFRKHAWNEVVFRPLVWRSAELSKARRSQMSPGKLAIFDLYRDEWFKELRRVRGSPDLFVLAVPTEVMIRPDVRKVVAYLLKRRRCLAVFDESDDWCVPGSKRTKMARAIANHCKFRIIMSGTMTTGSPLAAFTQFELLKKGALGFTKFQDFKDRYCNIEMTRLRSGRQFPKIVGFKNMDELRERMAPFISVVTREDIKDMPSLNPDPRFISPTPEQMRVYRELHDKITVAIRNQEVSIGELATRITKLQQVFSGFVIDEYKKVHRIPGRNPRLEMLLEEFYRRSGKIVVWCQFQEDIDDACAALRLDGYKVAEYHGRAKDKEDQLRAFKTDPKFKGLVAQYQAGARGRDMSEAGTILSYSHTFKARLRQQSLDRATKIKGENVAVVDFICPGPDKYILKVTSGRARLNDSLTGKGMQDLLGSLKL